MRNLYEQCLKPTQFAALEFEEIFQFSQENLKRALETELIENGYAARKNGIFNGRRQGYTLCGTRQRIADDKD